eukprot:m.180386 g.180386  ORF g.180386 m.180386 type:complete len:617 (+) comp53444_c0_seq3:183-2033(+)
MVLRVVGFVLALLPLASLHKLCVVVPFRDADSEIPAFASHMHQYLSRKGIVFDIVVVNQADSLRFNRGQLLNVGVIESEKRGCDYVVLHDIDLLPLNDLLPYEFTNQIMHIAAPGLHPVYAYEQFTGAIVSITVKDYRSIDGFSNIFWGWGGEDNEFRSRINRLGFEVHRPQNMGTNQQNTFRNTHPGSRQRDNWMEPRQNYLANSQEWRTGISNSQHVIQRISDEIVQGYAYLRIDVELICDLGVTPWCRLEADDCQPGDMQCFREANVALRVAAENRNRDQVKPEYLFSLILSDPHQEHLRTLRRHTSGDFCTLWFAVGLTDADAANEETILASLRTENATKQDIKVFRVQSQAELLMRALQWADSFHSFLYLVKSRAEDFLVSRAILYELFLFPSARLHWGFFEHADSPLNASSKILYAPRASVLSRDLVQFLALHGHHAHQFQDEDVALGSLLSPLRLNREHDPRWRQQGSEGLCEAVCIFIAHSNLPEAVRSLALREAFVGITWFAGCSRTRTAIKRGAIEEEQRVLVGLGLSGVERGPAHRASATSGASPRHTSSTLPSLTFGSEHNPPFVSQCRGVAALVPATCPLACASAARWHAAQRSMTSAQRSCW